MNGGKQIELDILHMSLLQPSRPHNGRQEPDCRSGDHSALRPETIVAYNLRNGQWAVGEKVSIPGSIALINCSLPCSGEHKGKTPTENEGVEGVEELLGGVSGS
jgi:hypothetical protein